MASLSNTLCSPAELVHSFTPSIMVLGLYWNLRAASAPTAHASMTRRQAEEAHRIRCERFQVGDCWTWLYRDANGDPSSWERYTVSTARGSDLEIELASKFAADEEFTTEFLNAAREVFIMARGRRR